VPRLHCPFPPENDGTGRLWGGQETPCLPCYVCGNPLASRCHRRCQSRRRCPPFHRNRLWCAEAASLQTADARPDLNPRTSSRLSTRILPGRRSSFFPDFRFPQSSFLSFFRPGPCARGARIFRRCRRFKKTAPTAILLPRALHLSSSLSNSNRLRMKPL